MEQSIECAVNCAKCPGPVCNSPAFMEGPDDCPTKVEAEVIQGSMEKYHSPEFAEFVRVASVVEGSSFTKVPWASRNNSPLTTRLEEVISFAKQMGYTKLGVAFCGGFMNEAKMLIPILENKGFDVISVCCKAGGIPKEEVGIKDEEKANPGRYEAMCNPISQAEILNHKGTEFNIMMGLCVGHDALFLKHAKALTTVFAVKDRLLAHNPLAALYLSNSYYRRLRRKGIAHVDEESVAKKTN